jgi:L-2-hydroxyglutarate oxidase LhgO
MKSYKNNEDELVFASDTPNIPYLYKEYQRSTQNGGNTANIADNDDIRLARWGGQTDDG